MRNTALCTKKNRSTLKINRCRPTNQQASKHSSGPGRARRWSSVDGSSPLARHRPVGVTPNPSLCDGAFACRVSVCPYVATVTVGIPSSVKNFTVNTRFCCPVLYEYTLSTRWSDSWLTPPRREALVRPRRSRARGEQLFKPQRQSRRSN